MKKQVSSILLKILQKTDECYTKEEELVSANINMFVWHERNRSDTFIDLKRTVILKFDLTKDFVLHKL